MNSAVVGVCGLGFMAMGVYGLAASSVSDRRRAAMAQMKRTRSQIVVGIAASAVLAIGGFASVRWLLWVGVTTFLAFGIFARKRMSEVEDPPAYVRRQLDRSMNPLVQLRHPVREFKATMTSMNVRRTLEEHRDWETRHDIPHRGQD